MKKANTGSTAPFIVIDTETLSKGIESDEITRGKDGGCRMNAEVKEGGKEVRRKERIKMRTR